MARRDWRVEYYDTADGQPVVEEEIAAFGPKVLARILRTVDLLEEFGVELGGEYIAHIRGKIWELRASRYRVLYFAFTGRRFVLLRAFVKKTRKTPDKEIKIAQRRQKDFAARAAPVRAGKGGATG
jgi:phage-related protein